MTGRLMCRHCGTRVACRPRGLCWRDFYAPGVKELYPPTSKYARRGVGNDFRGRPAAPDPTDALPGTEEKVAEMAARVAAGFDPFRRGDPTKPLLPKMGGLVLDPVGRHKRGRRIVRNRKPNK